MFWFLLKKAFFDAWDNLGIIVLGNLTLFVVMMAGLWPFFRILENGSPLAFLVLVPMVAFFSIAASVISALIKHIADYKRPAWSEIPDKLKSTWKDGLLLALVVTLFYTITGFGMLYYGSLKSMIALAAMALLFWISLGVSLALLWYFPVRNRLSGAFGKRLKKCAIIMFDNLGISIFIGIIVVPFQMLLWPLTAFAAFGPTGILLYIEDALRLLLFKYDWLEDNPEAKKRNIPWVELLIEEQDRVGKRTIKGMIFPWKE